MIFIAQELCGRQRARLWGSRMKKTWALPSSQKAGKRISNVIWCDTITQGLAGTTQGRHRWCVCVHVFTRILKPCEIFTEHQHWKGSHRPLSPTFSFYLCRNWGPGKLNDLPKDTQLVRAAKPTLGAYIPDFFQVSSTVLFPPHRTPS